MLLNESVVGGFQGVAVKLLLLLLLVVFSLLLCIYLGVVGGCHMVTMLIGCL